MAENLAELLHDETSGGPREYPEMDEEGPPSWTQRVVAVGREAAHRLWAALHPGDADAPKADAEREPRSGRPWAEMEASRGAEQQGTERQTPSLPERPDSPPSAFDRLAEELLAEGQRQRL